MVKLTNSIFFIQILTLFTIYYSSYTIFEFAKLNYSTMIFIILTFNYFVLIIRLSFGVIIFLKTILITGVWFCSFISLSLYLIDLIHDIYYF